MTQSGHDLQKFPIAKVPDQCLISCHGTDNCGAGLNSHQSTMHGFRAAAVAAAYLKVL